MEPTQTQITTGNYPKELVREFQRDIERVSIRKRGATYDEARRDIIRLLYIATNECGETWEARLLTQVCDRDIDVINAYVMDCLRAVMTGKTHIGGIGYNPTMPDGRCLQRGTGKHVRSNRMNTPKHLPNYISIRRILKVSHNDCEYSWELIERMLTV